MAKRRVAVKYSPSMLEPVRPGAESPDRALCLPTFSHFVIVNKTSLSLFLSFSLSLSLSDPLVRRAGRDHPFPVSAGSPWRERECTEFVKSVGHR
jgi:hypothetical protein